MKRKINEITVDQFRKNFKSLGYSEKESELTSSGQLKSDFLDILNEFVKKWYEVDKNKVCKLTFTSGNDNFHKNITSYISRHTKGEAVDVTLPENCHSSFIELLNQYKTKHNGFSYIDEYNNPTSQSTGGHFHISYRPNNPEGSGTGGSGTGGNSNTSSSSSSKSFDELGFLNPALDVLKTTGQAVKKSFDKTVSSMTENNLELDKKIISEIKRINNLMKK